MDLGTMSIAGHARTACCLKNWLVTDTNSHVCSNTNRFGIANEFDFVCQSGY